MTLHSELLVSGKYELAAVCDAPPHASGTALLCHGLTGDKSGPGGMLRELAYALADAGWRTYRWDLPGSGDSEGALEHVSFQDLVDSALDVAHVAQTTSGPDRRLILLGHSVGAIVALVAARKLRPESLVLIASDLMPGAHIIPPCDMSVRGGTFVLSESFWRQRRLIDPRALLRELSVPTLLVAPGDDSKVVSAMNEITSCARVTVPHADHLFTPRRDRLALQRLVLSFLEDLP